MKKIYEMKNLLYGRENLQVFLLAVLLLLLTYWSYYAGITVVNGDANAHYLSDAYYWWNNGGILSPPQWVPYAWMGRPGESNIQDSSYVLPVGIANLIHYWSPTTSAVLSSLYGAFGAYGMYMLVKKMVGNHQIALVALIAQFFFPTIFANAQFLDFQRGAALLPWLLLVMSPLWIWQRRISTVLAILIYWQVFVSVYPGQLVGAGICVVAWSIGWLTIFNNRNWFWRSIVTGLIGVLLASIKFIPALLQGTGDRPWEPQRIQITWKLLGSFFFPYDNVEMQNDIAVRPFFLVLPILFALFFVKYKSKKLVPVFCLGGSSITLLLLTVFYQNILEKIPGMNLSRFWVNDFRNFFLEALVLLGSFGLFDAFQNRIPRKALFIRASIFVLIMFLLASDLSWGNGIKNLMGLFIPFLLFALLLVLLIKTLKPGTFFVLVLGISVVSGLFFAYSVTSTWASPKNKVEVAHYGSSIANIVDQSKNTGACSKKETDRRKARLIPENDPSEWWHDTLALRGAFDCSSSIGGYVNVPGNPTLLAEEETFTGKNGDAFIKFFSAPGAIVPITSDGLPNISDKCLLSGDCPGIKVEPVKYMDSGYLEYRVDLQESKVVLLNESYYKGWNAEKCQQNCSQINTESGPGKSIQLKLSAGSYTVKFKYLSPYYDMLRLAFWVLIIVSLLTLCLKPMKEQRLSITE